MKRDIDPLAPPSPAVASASRSALQGWDAETLPLRRHRPEGRRAAAAAGLAATFLLALGGWACSNAGADPGPAAASADGPGAAALTAERGDLEQTVLLTGELRAERAVDLIVPAMPSWQVQLSWMLEDGTEVRTGDPLVEFDSSQFTSDLEERKLALREKENELQRLHARGEITGAEKRYEIARREVELEKATTRASVPADLMADREYQELQLALRTAELELEKARRDLEVALEDHRAEVELKEIEIADARREIDQAERAVASMTLEAPEDGIFVVQDHMWEPRKLQEGDMVHRGYTVARLPDLSTMEVRASLFDVDDGRIQPGMEGRCTLDAYPARRFPCRVVSVAPVARESNRNSLLRYFEVDLVLDEDDPGVMRPGMSVKVEVVTAREEDALLAPRAALDETGPGPRASLPGGGWVEIELGPCDLHRCVVREGLEEGTRLARVPPRPLDSEADPAGLAPPRVAAPASTPASAPEGDPAGEGSTRTPAPPDEVAAARPVSEAPR